MHTQSIKLIDQSRTVVATAQVVEQGEGFTGWIDLSLMPTRLRQRFAEYEQIVNGQMFSLLDEIEEQIGAMLLKVRFDMGYEVAIEDVQIYPSTRRVSFTFVKEAAYSTLKEPMTV